MKIAILCVVIVLSYSLAVTSAPADVLSSADSSSVVKSLQSLQKDDGLFDGILNTNYAIATLKLLGANVNNNNKLCTSVSKILSGYSSMAAIYHATLALDGAQCDKIVLSASHKETVSSSLKASSLVDAHQAAHVVFALARNKLAKLSDYNFAETVTEVLALSQDDGTYKSSADGKATSYYGGLALDLFASILSNSVQIDDTLRQKIRTASQRISQLMEQGTNDNDQLEYDGPRDVNNLVITSTVLRGAHALSSALSIKLDVSLLQMQRFATFFINHKSARAPQDLYHLISALQICAKNNAHVPLALTVDLKHNQVRVANVLGEAAANVKVSIETLTNQVTGKTASEFKNIELRSSSQGVFDLPNSINAGVYLAQLYVEPKDKDSNIKAFRDTRRIKKDATLKGVRVSVVVSADEQGKKDVSSAEGTSPQAISSVVKADKFQYLQVTVTLQGWTGSSAPSQVVIRLTHSQAAAAESYFIAKPTKKADQFVFETAVAANEFTSKLYGSGDYKATVVIGDASLERGLQYEFGTISLSNINGAIPSSLLSSSVALPEIKHSFRPTESRPPTVIALFFTIAVWAPFVLLLGGLLHLGVRIQITDTASGFLYNILFQTCLATILFSFVLYWLKLNIFQAFAAVAVLTPVTLFTGNRALKAHSQWTKSKSKKDN